MRRVVILGFSASKAEINVCDDTFRGREVWTVNDWWNFYPALRYPSRVYQIHDGLNEWNGGSASCKWRATPNWRDRYNNSGALVVTVEGVPELFKQRKFNVNKAIQEFWIHNIQSSIDYMLIDAMWEEVWEVELIGVCLKGEAEYQNQIPSAIRNVDECRRRGIKVISPDYRQWKAIYTNAGIDWTKMESVDLRYGSSQSQKVMMRIAEAKALIEKRVKTC